MNAQMQPIHGSTMALTGISRNNFSAAASCWQRWLAVRLLFALCCGLLTNASTSAVTGEPLLFFGDRNLPPYEFIENGQPKGANVDLARAIGRVLGRPVEVQLMDWGAAQSRLLAGEGHALTFLRRTDQRATQYEFSLPTLPVVFALFVRGLTTNTALIRSSCRASASALSKAACRISFSATTSRR